MENKKSVYLTPPQCEVIPCICEDAILGISVLSPGALAGTESYSEDEI